VSIRERPTPANARQEPGHWESDLVVGKGRAALQVSVERKTRYTRLAKTRDKSAQAAHDALRQALHPVPPALRRTITYDNGSENTLHVEVNADLGTRSFFCDPYASWQKGTVENTNGLIRRFLPKGTDLDMIPEAHLAALEQWLNHRPRKCLNFQTPAEAYHALSVALAG
jgi:IS30 family transposase